MRLKLTLFLLISATLFPTYGLLEGQTLLRPEEHLNIPAGWQADVQAKYERYLALAEALYP